MYLRNNKGVTLVEIIIVLGLMGGLGLAIAQIMKNMQQASTTAESNFDTLQISSTTSILLSNNLACTNTLKLAGQLTADKLITDIRNQSDNLVYRSGENYGKVTIETMEITGGAALLASTNNQLAQLVITFGRSSSAIGSKTTKKSFPVNSIVGNEFLEVVSKNGEVFSIKGNQVLKKENIKIVSNIESYQFAKNEVISHSYKFKV